MKNSKYWETEKGEVVKNTIDRKELLGSKEGADYLLDTIQEWREAYERGAYDD